MLVFDKGRKFLFIHTFFILPRVDYFIVSGVKRRMADIDFLAAE